MWELEGFGILIRSEWDIYSHIESGRLVPVPGDWTLPNADIFAVYPERANLSAKESAFIDFLTDWYKREADWVKN